MQDACSDFYPQFSITKRCSLCHVIFFLLTKLVPSRWLRIGLNRSFVAWLRTSSMSRLIYVQTRNLAISQSPLHIYQYVIQREETTTSSELSVLPKECQLTGGRSVGCLQRVTWGVEFSLNLWGQHHLQLLFAPFKCLVPYNALFLPSFPFSTVVSFPVFICFHPSSFFVLNL